MINERYKHASVIIRKGSKNVNASWRFEERSNLYLLENKGIFLDTPGKSR
jgi:hypothetical protein